MKNFLIRPYQEIRGTYINSIIGHSLFYCQSRKKMGLEIGDEDGE